MKITSLLLASTALVGMCVAYADRAEAFPGYGADTAGPAFIITVNPGGALSIAAGPSTGPYDGSDDTYIAVVNDSGATVSSFVLSSTLDIFGFDGDGIDTYGATETAGNPDTTGYGAAITYFTGINGTDTSGTVNFFGGLADGASTYFSLENAISLTSITNVPTTPTSTVPEPGTIGLLGAGLTGLGLLRRRKKAKLTIQGSIGAFQRR